MSILREFIDILVSITVELVFLKSKKLENKTDITKRKSICNDLFKRQSVQLSINSTNTIDLNLEMIYNNNSA